MKVLIFSTLFAPSVGGMETVMAILAEEFSKAGHQVKVVTNSKRDGTALECSYQIVRNPNIFELFKLINWSEISVHACVSLKFAIACFLARNKTLFIHHTWYENIAGKLTWKDKIKKYICRFATNISVSQAIADHLSVTSEVINNPYRTDIFYPHEGVEKTRDLIVVARLVSDKGVDQLLMAIAQLKAQGLFVTASIVGDGPERLKLEKLASDLQVLANVRFCGSLSAASLAKVMQEHKALIVPSKWREPFGVVVIEALACGLHVIAADGGGIKEALGPCGETYLRNDIPALAGKISQLLTVKAKIVVPEDSRLRHLENFKPSKVTELYLEIIKKATS